jgi:two-component system CheB/CheR fusion protein
MDTQDSDLIVVGIGTSAGGLDSLKEFFSAMPIDSDLAFVVIQHLDPNHVSYMADLLAKCTKMTVVQAEDGMPVEANSVYTIPPNRFLTIRNSHLCLTEPVKHAGARMPIDFFFRSLAEDKREKAICVIFSGSGSDGTLGLREVRGAGGMTLVQQPETAQFDAMLRSAIRTGMVDRVLPLKEMPDAILKYARQSYAGIIGDDKARFDSLDTILDLLATRNENDFTAYKKTTLLRRIERRMGLNHIASLSDYLRFLQENPDEIDHLAKDMLIGVSSFFRDAEAFDELRQTVIAPLIRERDSNSPLRVWVPGCATGEEPYSIAILLLEELAAANKTCPIQLFASDVAGDSLKFAREGMYPRSIAADVSEQRLNDFFTRQDSTYQVSKRLRESIIFSAQNLLTEAPFSKLDLISCRNLLIYIEPIVQRRILSLFAFALSPGGYLFLGKSDGMAGSSGLFTAVSSKWRIYRRNNSVQPGISEFLFSFAGKTRGGAPPQKWEPLASLNLSELNQHVLLKHFAASIALIDEQGNILHFYGATQRYLEHPTGEANLNLLNMLENRLAAKFRIALGNVIQKNEPVTLERVQFNRDDYSLLVNVTIRPVIRHLRGDRLFAVIFEDVHEQAPAVSHAEAQAKKIGEDESLVMQLELELRTLKAEFQTTINEYETSAEELKAANEEILSINEELQSTNEELETSKEEIQAVNEELNTVNNQLNMKVEEITQVNNDLVNFLNSSEIATIFLDKEFRIKRFTPSAVKLMNLISSDVGRPLSHVTHQFVSVDLTAAAEKVLHSVAGIEKDIQASSGDWYVMRCLPYRTLDNKIDGVIFTFTDVSALKRSEESMQAARNYAENIVQTIREPLLVLDRDLRVISANRAFYQTFQVSPQDTQNRHIFELGHRQWDIPQLRDLLEDILPSNTKFEDFEVDFDFPGIGPRTMLLNARRISNGSDPTEFILLVLEDFTERKRAAELLKSEEQLRQKALELEQQLIASGRLVSLGEITASMAHEFNNPLGIIMGFAEDLLSETDPTSPQYKSLAIIDEETKRCAKLIRSLLEFSRPTSTERRSTDVANAVRKSTDLVANHLYKQKIEPVTEMDEHLPKVDADPQQLEQVLVNLYLNAIDAMPDGGTLTVRASPASKSPENDTAGEVIISVMDTGFGIEPENLPKIFHPFFTAKKKTGLGLGLSICERIVKNHGGRIEVDSELGKGTSFKVHLPLELDSAQLARGKREVGDGEGLV